MWGGAAVTVLLVVVWIGSRWWGVDYLPPQGKHCMTIARGRLLVTPWPNDLGPITILQTGWHLYRDPAPRYFWHFGSGTLNAFVIPLWIPTMVTVTMAIISWRLDTLARRRDRLNLCSKCNYDRAGLTPGAVCPECGASATDPRLGAGQ